MRNVNQRTVSPRRRQRVSPTRQLASLAATLGVTAGELTLRDGDPDGTHRRPTSESNTAVRRVTSGKVLIDLVCDSAHRRYGAESVACRQSHGLMVKPGGSLTSVPHTPSN
jgi:hypothetical protein